MNPNPRLFFIGNFLSGTNKTYSSVEAVIANLTKVGWQVTTASSVKNPILRLFDMCAKVVQKQHDFDYLNISVFSGHSFVYAEIICRLSNWLHKPVFLTLNGGGLAEFADNHPKRVKSLFNLARKISTPSKFLISSLKIFNPEIVYIPNFIDLRSYHYRLPTLIQPKLIWIRAFHNIYQPWMAVQVLSELLKSYPNARLTMIGPDKNDGSLSRTLALAEQLGVIPQVEFIYGVSKTEIPQCLTKGDIFLNTTVYESFGVAVLEAAACGLPIISTEVGELPYLWENEIDALLVSPTDYHSMTNNIIRLMENPELVKRLSENARKKAVQFDGQKIMPIWEDFFLS